MLDQHADIACATAQSSAVQQSLQRNSMIDTSDFEYSKQIESRALAEEAHVISID